MHFLQRILVALAWLVVTAAFLLLVVEESGVLAGLVRTRLAWRLGPLAAGLTIERVSLRWFEPSLVLEDLRLRVPQGSARADDGAQPDEELLHLRRANLSLGLEEAGIVGRLQVQGGSIRISDRLLEALDSAADSLTGGGSGRLRLRPPHCSIRDLDVDLELPDGTPFQLGRASIVALPDEAGRYRLRGSVTPVLAGLVASPVEIHVDGRQWEGGLTIRTAAQGLTLQSRGFRRPPALEGLALEELSGELTLEACARLDWSAERLGMSGELRAQLANGRLLPRTGDPLLEALTCDVDLAFDLHGGERLWNRELWSARARLEAELLGSPFVAWGVFGRDLPPGTWAHAWARCDALPLDEEILSALGADARRRALWRSLAPRGSAPTTIDLRLAAPRLDGERPVWTSADLAVAVRPDGRMGVTYVGEPDPSGRPRGLPIPLEQVRGEVFFASRPALEGFARVAIDVAGDHPSGTARAAGVASLPERRGDPTGLDLEIQSDSLAVDETLHHALDGHFSTAAVWQDFQPSGGTLSFVWRLYEDASTRGLTGSGDIRLEGVSCAWRDLPIPFEGARGELSLRWARRSAWSTPDRLQSVRPFGLAYRFSNAEAAPAGKTARATVEGFVRDDFHTLDGPQAVPERKTQGLSIDLEELLLRGRDFEALAARFPSIARPVEDLGARGGVRVRFAGSRAAPSAGYRSAIEVSPTEAELTPSYFQRRTQDLRGRILITTEELAAGAATETRLALRGAWTGGVELACQGELYSGLPSRILVHGAGVDPSNTGFRGALFSALGASETKQSDMSQSAIEGRIDFTVQSELVPSSEVAPSNLYRVFLRHNALSNGSLRLEDLQGVLMQSGEVLGSPRVAAALSGHPLELRDVRVFRLADAARLAIADPILQRPTFWSDPDGYALQAELHVTDLPLDDRHLSSLLSEETLAGFRDNPDWRGALDVDGAQVVVTSESGLQGKVAVRGDVVPHDLALRFGIPIDVPRAAVGIEELIFEGGRVRGWGRVHELDASFFDRRLSEARMLFSYVDGRLSIDNLEGAFAGGRLESLGGAGQGTRKALAFDLAPPYHFDLALRLERVQVASLLEDVFQSSVADAGIIDAGLRLRGTPRHVLGITGGGWFELDEGRLWSIPVMRELFQQLGSDNTAVFDRMRSRFEVKDGRIETTDVRIRSALLNLVGSGWIDFDGTLSYDLEARYSLLDRLGPFNRILYWLNNSLWRVAVRGDMARPRVSIRNAVLEFLSGFDERPPRELPLPDFAPFPARF